MGQVFGATSQNGDRARAGTRPVSDYGPGARRGQPGEVPGLPDQRGRRAESVHNLLVPVFSLDLHFEPLVFPLGVGTVQTVRTVRLATLQL